MVKLYENGADELNVSDIITEFINEMIKRQDGRAELRRGELAMRFNCVPSQINYVIGTRFTPENGYIVETRRGGGGYIRITRVSGMGNALLMHALNSVGEAIDGNSARIFISNLTHTEAVSADIAETILAAVSDNALRPVPTEDGARDRVRASILKACLLSVY